MENKAFKDDPINNLLQIVFGRRLLISIGFLSVFSIAVIGSFLMPRVYESYVKIYVTIPSLPKLNVPYINELAGRSFLSNQSVIIKSRFIREKVVKKLRLHQVDRTPSIKKIIKDKIFWVETLGSV